MIPVSVNYVPVVLRSMSEICRAFGVGCEQVRQCGGFRLLIAGRFMPAYGCNTRG